MTSFLCDYRSLRVDWTLESIALSSNESGHKDLTLQMLSVRICLLGLLVKTCLLTLNLTGGRA